ncbi:MAG: Crp/Fnr family transcriptional regulator [Trueperaceae bacterium]
MSDAPRGSQQASRCDRSVRLAMLGRAPLFRDLDEAALARVEERCRAVACDSGEVLQHAGDPADTLWIVASGAVKLSAVGPEGKPVLHDVVAPGGSFGALRALGDPVMPYDAVAYRPGCLLAISADTFRALLREVPAVALAALEATADRLRDAERSVESLATLPVEGRLAATLLRLARKSDASSAHGTRTSGVKMHSGPNRAPHSRTTDGASPAPLRVDVAPSQVDLAAMTGTSAESVSRVFARWRAAGLIEVDRDGLVLRDVEGLAAFAS